MQIVIRGLMRNMIDRLGRYWTCLSELVSKEVLTSLLTQDIGASLNVSSFGLSNIIIGYCMNIIKGCLLDDAQLVYIRSISKVVDWRRNQQTLRTFIRCHPRAMRGKTSLRCFFMHHAHPPKYYFFSQVLPEQWFSICVWLIKHHNWGKVVHQTYIYFLPYCGVIILAIIQMIKRVIIFLD